MPRYKLLGFVLTISLVFIAWGTGTSQAHSLAQDASQGEQIFQAKCVGCHTIGQGVLVGPDLLGVTEKRDVQWLRKFIQNPSQVIASGDPTATQLLEEFNNLPMPNLGLSDQEVEALIAFLESQSGSSEITTEPPSASQGGEEPSTSQPAGDAARGQALFVGEIPFTNGGPPCMACHTVNGVGALGGGSMGPDLTFVANRYSEKGLAGVLQTLSFRVMQDVYAGKSLIPQEQADLLAFFIQQGNQPQTKPAMTNTTFMGYGGAIGVLLFLVMFIFWRGQRYGMATRMRRQS